MALEQATTINQLVETNPLGTDTKSQGDDHIRLIKGALRRTFPNITGPITVDEKVLNALAGGTNLMIPGMIIMWSGTALPPGWKLCDGTGTITTGAPVPDLRNKFILGAGGGAAINSTGGAQGHEHEVTVSGTALTAKQIPPHFHEHGTNQWTPKGIDTGPGSGWDFEPKGQVNFGDGSTFRNYRTSSVGEGEAHTHTGTTKWVSHLPPYFALAFIIKD